MYCVRTKNSGTATRLIGYIMTEKKTEEEILTTLGAYIQLLRTFVNLGSEFLFNYYICVNRTGVGMGQSD